MRVSSLIPSVAVVALSALGAMPGVASAQNAPQSAAAVQNGSVTIGGDVAKPFTLTLADLKAMPRTTVTVNQEDGTKTTFEGVLLGEILKRAGVPLGRELSGNAVASYILASASDGYQAVFAIAEADPAFTPSELIVADSIDGKPLFDYQGPMRPVAPHDKRGARGVRMLTKIEVVRLRK